MAEEKTIEELEKDLNDAYGEYMYYEAAERGYDFNAANKAKKKYREIQKELISKLEHEMHRAYGEYMYHEAAERGYDFNASRKAFSRYVDYKQKLKDLGYDTDRKN